MGTLRQILKIKPSEGTEKLPEGFKQKWIEALRGDRYIQATSALLAVEDDEDDDQVEVGFCCLGVAAHVCEIGREHLIGHGTLEEGIKSDVKWNHLRKRIPTALREDGDLQNILINFNDGTGELGIQFNFKQIAAWIEKYL